MSVLKTSVIALVGLLLSSVSYGDEYTQTVDRFRESGAVDFVDGAFAYAVFPTVAKGGIGIGGAYGDGKVFRAGQAIGTARLAQLTIGFQLGGQAYSQIIFFEDERALREFTSGNFEFGAQATAVALTASASAAVNTGGGVATSVAGSENTAAIANAGYHKGMAVFTIAKGGLMYEASIGGQKFSFTPSA